MLDALLFAARDDVRAAGFGYDARGCEVMPDGHPQTGMGNYFLAIHELPTRSTNDNCLMEYFGFAATLSTKIQNIPPDRVGDQLLAKKLARQPGPGGTPSFNGRCEQLRSFLHMNWGILQDANNYLLQWTPGDNLVYGFTEPARYRGMETPELVGGEWFNSGGEPERDDGNPTVGLKCMMRFEDARRMQPIGLFQ